MSNLVETAKIQLNELINKAISTAIKDGKLPEGEIPQFVIEIPSDTAHGDFATNIAMVSARAFHLAPKKIAEIICEEFDLSNSFFEKSEIAGPGFINFFLQKNWFANVVSDIISEGENYGRSDFGKGEKVMIEFVSANPTGPMHMGNARGGSIGDCLAAAMDWAGYKVHKEFYINDAGNQIAKFGNSLEARYLQIFKGEDVIEFPEDGYHGEDIKERAKGFAEIYGDKYVDAIAEERQKALINYALPLNIEKLRTDLKKYRIEFDEWFAESQLHASGAVMNVVEVLKNKNLAYEKDGAVWYKATEFGGEKDEVLVRANGFPTYFTADIAYHYNKFVVRGFDKCIDVWGADHHGHVARLKGAMNAIGLDGNKLDIVLMQLVNLTKDGEVVKMSKRTGKAITLSDLIEEIPIDAARFFFNMREPNSTLDFDLDLAVEESSKNPVYYVQYAHARICSILKNLEAEGIETSKTSLNNLELLTASEEIELIRILSRLTSEIIMAAKNYDPARLTHYIVDVATAFHSFYTTCHVRVPEKELMEARIELCKATRYVIKNVLTMIKVDAPEKMTNNKE